MILATVYSALVTGRRRPDSRPQIMQAKDEKKEELLLNQCDDDFKYMLFHWQVCSRVVLYTLLLMMVMVLDIASSNSLSTMVHT